MISATDFGPWGATKGLISFRGEAKQVVEARLVRSACSAQWCTVNTYSTIYVFNQSLLVQTSWFVFSTGCQWKPRELRMSESAVNYLRKV
eukprot:scaffold2911_cov159-Skeletonema_dohrnii-CCMP3373.AAC.16